MAERTGIKTNIEGPPIPTDGPHKPPHIKGEYK